MEKGIICSCKEGRKEIIVLLFRGAMKTDVNNVNSSSARRRKEEIEREKHFRHSRHKTQISQYSINQNL
jgi:hypothetical protein